MKYKSCDSSDVILGAPQHFLGKKYKIYKILELSHFLHKHQKFSLLPETETMNNLSLKIFEFVAVGNFWKQKKNSFCEMFHVLILTLRNFSWQQKQNIWKVWIIRNIFAPSNTFVTCNPVAVIGFEVEWKWPKMEQYDKISSILLKVDISELFLNLQKGVHTHVLNINGRSKVQNHFSSSKESENINFVAMRNFCWQQAQI